MGHRIFTIGHSTRSLHEFVSLLRPQEVRLVVDVRSVPRSLSNPQYNAARLARALSELDIGYEHIPGLGGLRGKRRDVAATVNSFWKNRSFHNFADYAMSDEFRCGLAKLRKLGHCTTSAIMCAEAVWWRCHRRIIADYLITEGETVFHILANNQVVQASLTRGAVLLPDGTLHYPASPFPRTI
ncbi:DUF488 domain-containing protein [Bradyrhizobium sp. 160]|uniref:DUF488 domain-containing protein n=1 Tax=Bradyrhizobium sp. 160 TaxID=2782634 RepID=UPI001FF8033D|nr:DUF488 domain-containing protein [Bradyrhizobium sp. 160]MCK1626789.1 DUF488 domain-containing protein [Bradyrhizobium sp. 160]